MDVKEPHMSQSEKRARNGVQKKPDLKRVLRENDMRFNELQRGALRALVRLEDEVKIKEAEMIRLEQASKRAAEHALQSIEEALIKVLLSQFSAVPLNLTTVASEHDRGSHCLQFEKVLSSVQSKIMSLIESRLLENELDLLGQVYDAGVSDGVNIMTQVFARRENHILQFLSQISEQRDLAVLEMKTMRNQEAKASEVIDRLSRERDAALIKADTISAQAQKEAIRQARAHERTEAELRSAAATKAREDAQRMSQERARLSQETTKLSKKLNAEHTKAMDRALRTQARRHERALAAALQARDLQFKTQLEAKLKRDSDLAKTLKKAFASTASNHNSNLKNFVTDLDHLCHDLLTSAGRETHPPLRDLTSESQDLSSDTSSVDHGSTHDDKSPNESVNFLRRGDGERRREILAIQARKEALNTKKIDAVRPRISLRDALLTSISAKNNHDQDHRITHQNSLHRTSSGKSLHPSALLFNSGTGVKRPISPSLRRSS